ncbi:MAG: type II toxin-antitoxin system RelE/ParE family toxin [Chloroflexi bacterium]|nr:type II toxin-antitoxin system RelE/ParE family toxin [Chloroflexota bacterium]
MKVRFADRQLERCFLDGGLANRTWGESVGQRFVQRVKVLQASSKFEDLFEARTLRLHPLTGNRSGQWALKLIGRWRLIFRLSEDRQTITLAEVSNYYGN